MADRAGALEEDFDPRPLWVGAGLFVLAGVIVVGEHAWERITDRRSR